MVGQLGASDIQSSRRTTWATESHGAYCRIRVEMERPVGVGRETIKLGGSRYAPGALSRTNNFAGNPWGAMTPPVLLLRTVKIDTWISVKCRGAFISADAM